MSAWFVFLIDGIKVAFWANSSMAAEKILKNVYHEGIKYKFLGIYCPGLDSNMPDIFCENGRDFFDYFRESLRYFVR